MARIHNIFNILGATFGIMFGLGLACVRRYFGYWGMALWILLGIISIACLWVIWKAFTTRALASFCSSSDRDHKCPSDQMMRQ